MNILSRLSLIAAGLLTSMSVMAQSSLPAPGGAAGPGRPGGGNSLPAPGGMATPGGPGGPAAPAFGRPWGSPWNSPWGPNMVNWQNSGTVKVVGCGYDSQGVWRVIPMKVAYTYNGMQYNVTVLNAWNPWTDMWDYGVDQPAYNTSYYINGNTYNFYTPLSTGTYYFNL